MAGPFRAGWEEGVSGHQRSAIERSTDPPRVVEPEVTQDGLRGVLEAIGCEPCFREYVTLDIAGNGLCVSLWLVGLAAVVEVVRPETLQLHMRPPGVVPVFEFGTQGREVVESLDNRHASQPLVLEGSDDAFGDRDLPVFVHGADAGFDVPFAHQRPERISDKDLGPSSTP